VGMRELNESKIIKTGQLSSRCPLMGLFVIMVTQDSVVGWEGRGVKKGTGQCLAPLCWSFERLPGSLARQTDAGGQQLGCLQVTT
jgi:hypothetical protein